MYSHTNNILTIIFVPAASINCFSFTACSPKTFSPFQLKTDAWLRNLIVLKKGHKHTCTHACTCTHTSTHTRTHTKTYSKGIYVISKPTILHGKRTHVCQISKRCHWTAAASHLSYNQHQTTNRTYRALGDTHLGLEL